LLCVFNVVIKGLTDILLFAVARQVIG